MANDIILPKKLHLTVSQICWIQVIYEYVSPGIRRCSLTCQAVHRPWLTPGGDDSIFMWCRAQLITSYECHWTPVAVWYIVPFKPIQSSYPFGKMHWFEMIYSPLLIIHTIFLGFYLCRSSVIIPICVIWTFPPLVFTSWLNIANFINSTLLQPAPCIIRN